MFWLSLIPFMTTWMGESHVAALPTALYGVVLLACAIAYTILQMRIIVLEGSESPLAKAVGSSVKEKASIALYCVGIFVAFAYPLIADIVYAVVAMIWLVPDKRIESQITTA
jgi:uncharacterized membrane protein